MSASTCRVCGCTDADCQQCIEKTGSPCVWVEGDLCSACSPGAELRRELDAMVLRGQCSPQEADEAFRFLDELSDAELLGGVSHEQALGMVELLGLGQLDARSA